MKTVFPDYYGDFRCIAAACRHTCCRGWEIDVDSEALARYQAVPGALGARLRSEILTEPEPHFRLRADECCPFFNRDGLCDLILQLGEDALCQICRDHPRFRNFFSDRTEIGLGLCCEGAAELILTQQAPVRLVGEGTESLTPEEEWILETRARYIALMQDRTLPLPARWQRLAAQTGADFRTPEQWMAFYSGLERLEPQWDTRLEKLRGKTAFTEPPAALAVPLEQLTVYFLYRHLPGALLDGDVPARTAFSVLSACLISELWAAEKGATLSSLWDIAREYSAEIEYSEENLCALLDALSAGDCGGIPLPLPFSQGKA